MAKRAVLSLIGLFLAVVAMSALSGCFLLGGPGVGGYVFDAYSGNAIAGATVTITDTSGDSYQATTNTSGQWFVSKPKQGSYSVSASGGGFYFTTPVYPVAYVSGATATAQTIAGVQMSDFPTFSGYSDYLFILVWNGSPSTLNMHMTFPNGQVVPTDATPGSTIDSPSWLPSNSAGSGGSSDWTYWNSGFGPTFPSVKAGSPGRVDCNYANPNPLSALTGGSDTLRFLANDQGGGPETIDMSGAEPVNGGYALNATEVADSGFPSGTTQFAGVAELYLDGAGTSLANLGNAVVYVIQVSGGTVTPFGAFAINQDSSGQTGVVLSTSTVSVLRMNILDAGFQIVPDFKAVQSGVMGSVKSTSTGPTIINLPRK